MEHDKEKPGCYTNDWWRVTHGLDRVPLKMSVFINCLPSRSAILSILLRNRRKKGLECHSLAYSFPVAPGAMRMRYGIE
jgi:hypothetical protein